MAILSAKKLASCVAVVALGWALPASAATVTIVSADFDSPASFYPGVTGSLNVSELEAAVGGPYNGSNGKSWAGLHATVFDTTVMTLTLNNLPTHSQISIDFLLGFLNSWDSSNGTPAPDLLSISIEGGAPVQLTTVIATGGTVNEYQGGTLLVDNGQIDINDFFADDLVDMGTASFLTFAHSASTLTMTIQAGGAGWQGGRDEYWGLDALRVTAVVPDGNVPEPTSLALLGLALVGAAGLRRRRA